MIVVASHITCLYTDTTLDLQRFQHEIGTYSKDEYNFHSLDLHSTRRRSCRNMGTDETPGGKKVDGCVDVPSTNEGEMHALRRLEYSSADEDCITEVHCETRKVISQQDELGAAIALAVDNGQAAMMSSSSNNTSGIDVNACCIPNESVGVRGDGNNSEVGECIHS